MTARTHQSNTKSGQARTRTGSRSKTRTTSSTGSPTGGARQSSRGKRRKSEKSNKSVRVLLMMVVVGGVIGAIFVMAQKLQINTLQLKRAEEGLKSEIDTYSSQQRFLTFQKEKALSTQESDKAAGEFNLTQPGIGRAVVAPTEPETKNAAKPVATKAAAKQQAPVKQTGKLAKNAKATAPGKPVKSKKDSKQIAKNQQAKNLPTKNLATKNLATKNLATKNLAARNQATKSQASRKEARR